MADVNRLKKRSIGTPPPLEEASPNLEAPETAPASPTPPAEHSRRDGRSLRKTNRTVPFATRVSADFDNKIRDIAERDGLKLVEVLEQALEAYERENNAAN